MKLLMLFDTPAEAFEQSNNRQKLIDLINQGKAHLLPGKTPWKKNWGE